MVLLLVADAPPHREALNSTFHATEHLRKKRVRTVPDAARGVEDSAQLVMGTMAVLTGERYIFLTDDNGIGNVHVELTKRRPSQRRRWCLTHEPQASQPRPTCRRPTPPHRCGSKIALRTA